MKLRLIGVTAGFCALTLGLGAGPAFASSPHGASGVSRTNHHDDPGVTAVTHTRHHADTSTKAGACTTPSSAGPVWAYDNLSFRFRVTSLGSGNYTVTITASGSYKAFASRLTGACTAQRGSVRGFVNDEVHSAKGPDRADLPSQEPGNVAQSTMLDQLFQTTATITSGPKGYSYTYTFDGKKCVTSTKAAFHCS